MHVDNPFAMVVMIVLIVSVASVLRAKFGYRRHRDRDRERSELMARDDGETRALRDEVSRLRDRLEVLERITVEKENSLAREIESLRDR